MVQHAETGASITQTAAAALYCGQQLGMAPTDPTELSKAANPNLNPNPNPKP